MAYQIGFDLYDGATQHFLRRVQDCLRPVLPVKGGGDKSEGEGERWVGCHTPAGQGQLTHPVHVQDGGDGD